MDVMGAMGVDELAQRALADVFEQLERIGAAGRERCRGAAYSATPHAPVSRAEALGFIRCAENALDYARVHLDYLARAPEREPPPLTAGERVEVRDAELGGRWFGTVAEIRGGGQLFVRNAAGELEAVDERDVSPAPHEAAE